MKGLRVFLLSDVPTREKVEFLNLLGKQCELTVAFEEYPKENNIWHFSAANNEFKSIFLQGLKIGRNSVSFGLGKIINQQYYDVYVIGDCKTNTEKAVIREMVLGGKKFVIASEGAFPDINENKLIKARKADSFRRASYYLSCGSASDAYLASYGVDMSRVFRYNLASFSEKDVIQSTPMTTARKRGLISRFRLKENIFISTIDFTEDQGIDVLLDVWKFAGIDNADLLIISDAAEQKRLHKMVKSLALNNVAMLDYQPKELTRELIKLSKAMIYPARHDLWGMPVVEALSCGTPVVSSYNVGAVHDLVHNDRTGYIRNIEEPASWGECLRDILKRDALLASMRKNSLHSMKSFTMESRVKTYIDVFKKCAIIQSK